MKSPKWGGKWIVPGGKVEKGDTVEETLRKELREETGLEIEDIQFMEVKDGGNPDEFERETHFVFLNYLCRAVEGQEVELDLREAVEYRWIDPSEALQVLDLNSSTEDFLQKFVEVS